MIESVAKAICDCSGYESEFHLEDWAPAARAAIHAMRVPTPDMIRIARGFGIGSVAFTELWQAMIDEMLK